MLYIVVLSKSDAKTKQLTKDCLKSISAAELDCMYEPFSKTFTIVVESGECTPYNCDAVISYDKDVFNYNHACNLALDYVKKSWQQDDWVCFMNNDIVCSKDWIKELAVAKKLLPSVQSLCPNIGLVDADGSKCKLMLGYMLKKTFNGCCFLMSKQALDKLGAFDEAFSFYFQDDDLLEQLRHNEIQHGIALDSHIQHLGQATTGPEDFSKLVEGAKAFIQKHSMETYLAREAGKALKIDLSKLENIKTK